MEILNMMSRKMEVIIMLQNHKKLIRKPAKESRMMGRREKYGEEKKQLIIQRIPQYLSSMREEMCMLASGIGPLMCNDVLTEVAGGFL